ncbi:unnamed protein product [Bursaphelenchus okinawaensis]|uniref:Uncharacterized protein n=1 Tax=Bursaphelenchus okinawaensis TaxID=465554 RepID=A0A811JVF9_9BILA|nr:unnamed protein product [Bursaphelenchus okinawaensis]CAG9084827.1 unnamed protein product [Bursaphelenchus okinawaensis]
MTNGLEIVKSGKELKINCTLRDKMLANQCSMVVTQNFLSADDFTGLGELAGLLDSFDNNSMANGLCDQFWQLMMCARFVGPCFSEILSGTESMMLYRKVGYAFGICSNHTVEVSKEIEDCHDTLSRSTCNFDSFDDGSGCNEEYYSCVFKQVTESCPGLSAEGKRTICLIFAYSQQVGCPYFSFCSLYERVI